MAENGSDVANVQDGAAFFDLNLPMAVKLASINLETRNPLSSKRFYIEGFGLKENIQRSHGDGFVYLESEGADITIATPEIGDAAAPSTTMELGFETDDIEALRERIAAIATFPVEKKSMRWGDVVETRDFDGHRVVAYQFRQGGPESKR